MKRSTKIALITSGGDCQGLNAAIRGVGKSLFQRMDNVEIYGMYDGYRGLIEGDYKYMEPQDLSGILTEGGTILGTSRQNYVPGKDIVDDKGNSVIPSMLQTYNRLNLDCLVIMGGNGTQKSAKLIADAGMNVITLPKTIDNDIWGTDTPSASRAPLTSPRTSSTISTPPQALTAVFLSWSLWDATPAGSRSTPVSAAVPMLYLSLRYPTTSIRSLRLIEERNRRGKRYSIIACAEGWSRGRYQATRRPAAASARTAGTPPSPHEIADRLESSPARKHASPCPGTISAAVLPARTTEYLQHSSALPRQTLSSISSMAAWSLCRAGRSCPSRWRTRPARPSSCLWIIR